MSNKVLRIGAGVFSVVGLIAFFLFFQDTDLASFFLSVEKPISKFLINRSFRFLFNDFFAILLIYALFGQRKYVVFSLWVQFFGLVFLLIPYFVLKIYFPSYNGPLLNFLHRIILNPTLLLLLIPAFYYQEKAKLG